jgi:hypothetical protein
VTNPFEFDTSAFLADFGVPVVFGGYSVLGILDDFDSRNGFGGMDVDVVERLRVVTIPTDAAASTPFRRNSIAYQQGAAGVYSQVAVDVLRTQHYIGGVLQPPLIEAASTNVGKKSNNFADPAWTKSNTTAVQDQNGLDGTFGLAATLSDISAVALGSVLLGPTNVIANDNAQHVISAWVLKDANTARFPGFRFGLTGGAIVRGDIKLNTQTGAVIVQTVSGVVQPFCIDAGPWWIVYALLTNNSSGNVNMTAQIFPAMQTVFGADNVAAQGSIVCGQVQFEPNKTVPTSPIFTDAAAVTRAADVDQMFSATQNGYGRQFGSFITEGFKAGGKLAPIGFASNPQSTVMSVSDTFLGVSDPRAIEAAVAGRSLSMGLPGIKRGSSVTVDGKPYKVRDVLQMSDGNFAQLHVVTP